jgi:MoxR-like ATPase
VRLFITAFFLRFQTRENIMARSEKTTEASTRLRLSAEETYRDELEVLAKSDDKIRPAGWRMSPQAVVTYLMGGKIKGAEISAKYIGNRRLIETAVATLATDRALLILGVPGTAKSWVSEHLAAAICGNSQRLIQCTAGTDETQIRYGWNYALLLAKGPSRDALVPTPLFRAMEEGSLLRLEELTRMGSDVQDTLITVLSEKILPIPELNGSVEAHRGFNVIATANNRDKGVNDLSSALKRRFNVVVLPLPTDVAEETSIVVKRVNEIGTALSLPEIAPAEKEIARIVTLFRELRDGQTLNGKTKLKSPTGTLSTGEAISVAVGAWAEAAHFGDGEMDARSLSANIVGAVVKDPVQDAIVLQEYLETVVRERWNDLYRAIKEVM